MSSVLVAAGLPSNYTTAAELTLAIPLAVFMIVLGWWVWWSRTKAHHLEPVGQTGLDEDSSHRPEGITPGAGGAEHDARKRGEPGK